MVENNSLVPLLVLHVSIGNQVCKFSGGRINATGGKSDSDGGREGGGMPFQLERFPIGRGIMEHQFHVF